MQINVKADMTFASALRSILRSDPDVIMVGEIRDPETAKMAIESALTGHFVLSTLHTNDAPGALTRLNEMGVEPFLTGSAVSAVLAQRLARKLCANCCEMYTPTPEELMTARISPDMAAAREGMVLYRKVGCPRCNRTGYKGRVGVFQLLIMNDEIESLAAQNAHRDEIERAAAAGGHAVALGRRDREGRRGADLARRARPRRLDLLTHLARRLRAVQASPAQAAQPPAVLRQGWRRSEGRRPLGDGAVQVLERDERLVGEAAGVVERGERERPRHPGLPRRLCDGKHLGLDRDAVGRLVGAERRDDAAVAANLVLEERAGGIGSRRSRPGLRQKRSCSTTRAGVVRGLCDDGAFDRARDLGHDLAGTADDEHRRGARRGRRTSRPSLPSCRCRR